MKVTMVMLITIDGKMTKWNDPNIYKWTSKEDQRFFFSLIRKNNLIVMGRKTYEAAKKNLRINNNKLRVILTKNPEKYAMYSIPNKLEFSNLTPEKLIEKLGKRGYKKMLLVSGGAINSHFLKANLVDELFLTIEPRIFGIGKPIVSEENLNTILKLVSSKRINKQGTLLLKYKILN